MYRDREHMSDWDDRAAKLGEWDAAFTGAHPNPGGTLEPAADFSAPRTTGQATKARRRDT